MRTRRGVTHSQVEAGDVLPPNPSPPKFQGRQRIAREDTKQVPCWCERKYVAVVGDLIARGFTESCGTPRCDRLDRAQHRRSTSTQPKENAS